MNDTVTTPIQAQNIEIPNGFKQTSIGLIPSDWEVKKLSDVFDYINTPSFSRDNLTFEKTNTEVKYIHYGDIHSKFKSELLDVKKEIIPYLKDEFVDENKLNFLSEGDLVIADASEDYKGIGECIELKNVGNIKIISGLHTIVARGKDNLTQNGFKTYIFNSQFVANSIRKIATGISVYGVSKGNLSKLLLPLPTLPEQQKIASILSTWDIAIDNCKGMIEQLKVRNKGLTQKLLTGKLRAKGFDKNWKVKVMSECLNFTPRPILKPSENYLALGLRSHGKGIFHKNDFDPASIAMETMYEVEENDLIINITFAWEHAVAIVSKKDEGGLVSHRFPTYTFNSQNAIPDFFRHFVLQKYFKFLLELISPGGAGRNRVMSKKDFLKLEVKLPDVAEQKAIANILDKATEELKQYEQKLQTLQLQKKGLMQRLLTGKVRTV